MKLKKESRHKDFPQIATPFPAHLKLLHNCLQTPLNAAAMNSTRNQPRSYKTSGLTKVKDAMKPLQNRSQLPMRFFPL